MFVINVTLISIHCLLRNIYDLKVKRFISVVLGVNIYCSGFFSFISYPCFYTSPRRRDPGGGGCAGDLRTSRLYSFNFISSLPHS